MESGNQSNGWQTFLEHWGFLLIVLVAFSVGKVLDFFTQLNGTLWIWFFAASFILMISGGCLIGSAKFPVYRGGHFLTFGIKSVPKHLTGYYRWGWGVFLFGFVLGLCLLLSKP